MTSVFELHIEEIVLSGFPPMDGYRMRKVVEQHLTSLLIRNSMPEFLTRHGSISRLDGGEFQSVPDAGIRDFGASIAQNIYTSLAGSTISKGDNRQ